MNLLFCDTETTGTEAEDRLCQVCFRLGELERNELFKPPLPIKVGAMAVHHITNEMVEDKPAFIGTETYNLLQALRHNTVFVAHNAPFDIGMLRKEGLEFGHVIDTLKIARHLDEEAILESHGLQYLRYYHGLKVEAVAHDALGDVRVLQAVYEVLRRQLAEAEGIPLEAASERMLEISSRPALIRRFNFGKHRGELLTDIVVKDRGYLKWLQNEKAQNPEGEEDWLYTLDLLLRK